MYAVVAGTVALSNRAAEPQRKSAAISWMLRWHARRFLNQMHEEIPWGLKRRRDLQNLRPAHNVVEIVAVNAIWINSDLQLSTAWLQHIQSNAVKFTQFQQSSTCGKNWFGSGGSGRPTQLHCVRFGGVTERDDYPHFLWLLGNGAEPYVDNLHLRFPTRDWPALYQFCRAASAQEAVEKETDSQGISKVCSHSPN